MPGGGRRRGEGGDRRHRVKEGGSQEPYSSNAAGAGSWDKWKPVVVGDGGEREEGGGKSEEWSGTWGQWKGVDSRQEAGEQREGGERRRKHRGGKKKDFERVRKNNESDESSSSNEATAFVSRGRDQELEGKGNREEVNATIIAFLETNSALQLVDFDFRIRQHFHAQLTNGGRQRVQEALHMIQSATSEKERGDVRNWPGYLAKLLRTFDQQANSKDREARAQARSDKVNEFVRQGAQDGLASVANPVTEALAAAGAAVAAGAPAVVHPLRLRARLGEREDTFEGARGPAQHLLGCSSLWWLRSCGEPLVEGQESIPMGGMILNKLLHRRPGK